MITLMVLWIMAVVLAIAATLPMAVRAVPSPVRGSRSLSR